MSEKISRRRFLTYTFGATAGFSLRGSFNLWSGLPSILYSKKGTEAEITENPKSIQFVVHQKDGWYEPPKGTTLTAWVFINKGKILALSPICKHLGCTVDWNSNPQFKNQFFCPCHFGRYYKDGTNVPGTPPAKPLDKYKIKIENGRLLIGPLVKT